MDSNVSPDEASVSRPPITIWKRCCELMRSS
jgi:hypothetical protein